MSSNGDKIHIQDIHTLPRIRAVWQFKPRTETAKIECLRKSVFKKLRSIREQSEFPSHHDLDVFADEVNQMLQATLQNLRGGVGGCGNAAQNKIEKLKAACE